LGQLKLIAIAPALQFTFNWWYIEIWDEGVVVAVHLQRTYLLVS